MTLISDRVGAEVRILTRADRASAADARRHFDAGGAVLVSQYGHEPHQVVYLDTTFHTRETTTWEALYADVRNWRSRYPNQRFYLLRPVDVDATTAELAALLRDHAHAISEDLIDENVVDERHLRAASLAWKLSRLLASALALRASA